MDVKIPSKPAGFRGVLPASEGGTQSGSLAPSGPSRCRLGFRWCLGPGWSHGTACVTRLIWHGGAWHHGCTTIEKGFKLTRHGEKMIGPLHTALEIPKTFHINEIEWQFNRNSMMSILLWESLDVVLLTLLKLANMNNMELDIAPWSPSAMLWLLQYDTAQHEWAWQWWLISIGENLIWTTLYEDYEPLRKQCNNLDSFQPVFETERSKNQNANGGTSFF